MVLDGAGGMSRMSLGVEVVDHVQIPELLVEVAASLRGAVVSTDGYFAHSESRKVDNFGSAVSSKSWVLRN